MIKIMFIPKKKERPIKPTRSFYVDTHSYKIAEDKARAEFKSDPEYQHYEVAACIDINVIYP